MRTLLVLIGVGGAGKTSVLNEFVCRSDVCVLQPSTTRAPRAIDDSEYDFRQRRSWNSQEMAWEICVGPNLYGMRKSELARVEDGKIAMTVFHPAKMSTLCRFKVTCRAEIVTVGLDTVCSINEQIRRTNGEAGRVMREVDFDQDRSAVQSCDVVLRSDVTTVCGAIDTLICMLCGRGGVVPGDMIASLMRAGTLLHGGEPHNVSTASYDLRIGNDVWCQGKFVTLNDKNPTLRIPPYSYAIVRGRERIEGKDKKARECIVRGLVASQPIRDRDRGRIPEHDHVRGDDKRY